MRHLLFTLEYPPFFGGVANYYANLVEYWNDRNQAEGSGDDLIVLNNNDNELINQKLPAFKWLPSLFRLYKTIKREGVGHVFVGHILPLGTATYFVSKILPIEYTVFLHGMDLALALKHERKRRIALKILRDARFIICTNSYVAGMVFDLLGEGERQKIRIVNPGIDKASLEKQQANLNPALFEHIKKKHGLENKTVLFSVSRLVKRKGADRVIEAMPIIVNQMPNISYVIAGTGPDETYLKELANSLPEAVKKHIIFLGKITDDEKWTWLNLSDIFLMPSRDIAGDFEGFGIVYLEANLAGKPVIAGDSGGVRDAVETDLNGILVDPEDSPGIANAILLLAGNPELQKRLGEQGRARVLNDFTWEKQITEIYKLYNHQPSL